MSALKSYLIALTALTVLTVPTQAQGWIDPLPGPRPEFAVVKLRSTVTVRITDRVAQVEVEEWFENRGPRLGEGDYLYPLPGEAVFSNFSLFQGDQELRGETMDAQTARSIYEEIVRKKRDPALIELVGHGLVRARVFPFGPGETRKITMRYTQLLSRAGDALEFVYAAGGRHAGRQTNVEGATNRPGMGRPTTPIDFTLIADNGDMFRDPFSPTHRVRVERENGRLRVRPEGELSGNLSLFLPLARGLVGVTVATHRPSTAEPGYFMLSLSPGQVDGTALPRDLSVVVDVSGSMSGAKLSQAQEALRQLLGTLGPRDRFRLIGFSNTVTTFHPSWTAASERNLTEARRWVGALVADGGTNIDGALEEAFRVASEPDRVAMTVFLTDGLPSVGEKDPDRIAQRVATRRGTTRVFAFGVGYDVNTYLLDRLTAEGRGATEYVEPGENVEMAVSTLSTKIRHPVLTDLVIDDAPVQLTEVYPRTLPDLFAGEDLIVFGRYDATSRDRSGEVRLTGRRSGATERFATTAVFANHELDHNFIPRLWASRKLGFLTRQLRLEGESADLLREIRETAMQYGLLSEYTSYLVQEPEIVAANRASMPMTVAPGRPGQGVASGGIAFRDSRSRIAVNEPVGQKAVAAAEESRRQRQIQHMAELDQVNDAIALDAVGSRTQQAGGRTFTNDAGVWRDAMHHDSLRVVDVAPYSEAYFELLRQLPELEIWLVSFEQVLVAGDRVSIRFVTSGTKQLAGAELAKLARDFRGR